MIPKAIAVILKRENLNEAYRVMLEDHCKDLLDTFALLNNKVGNDILLKCKAKMDSEDDPYDNRLKETVKYLYHETDTHKDILFEAHKSVMVGPDDIEEHLKLTPHHEKF